MTHIQAINAVQSGDCVESTPTEWLVVRAALRAYADAMNRVRKFVFAKTALQEIERLDETFGYVPGKPYAPGKVDERKAQPPSRFFRPGDLVVFVPGSKVKNGGPFTVRGVQLRLTEQAQDVTLEEIPGTYDSESLKRYV
jgi:hypothetical protein